MKPWISAINKELWLCYLSEEIILNNGIVNLISFRNQGSGAHNIT